MNVKQAKRVAKKLSTGLGVLECTLGGIEFMRTKGVQPEESGLRQVAEAIQGLQKQLAGIAEVAKALRAKTPAA